MSLNLSLLDFLIFGLAVWRLSYMIVEEDGPADMFKGLRWLAGWRLSTAYPNYPPTRTTWFDQHWFDKPNWLLAIVKTPAGIVDCIYCASVWVSAAFLALHHFLPLFADVVTIWLALSAVAVIIKERLVK